MFFETISHRQTDKSLARGFFTKILRNLSWMEAERIAFPDRQAHGHLNERVPLLLKYRKTINQN